MGTTWPRVRLAAPGTADRDILRWAIREERILLTFDKDFGELARASALPRPCGIVLFRVPTPPREETGRQLAALLDSRTDWDGHFRSSSRVAFACDRSIAGERARLKCHERARTNRIISEIGCPRSGSVGTFPDKRGHSTAGSFFDIAWRLFQVDERDRPIAMMGEAVLETDPTGREIWPT